MIRRIVVLALCSVLVACGDGERSEHLDDVDAIVAAIFGEQGETDAQFTHSESSLGRDGVLRECMNQAGFDFLDWPHTATEDDPTVVLKRSLDDEEFAERYGYGISTLESERDIRFEINRLLRVPDPNIAYRDTLDFDQQARYDAARWGEVEFASEDGTRMGADPMAGCEGRAVAEQIVVLLPAEAGAELGSLEAAISADPRMVEVVTDWSSCMSADGWQFTSPESAVGEMAGLMIPVLSSTTETKRVRVRRSDGREVEVTVRDFDIERLSEIQSREIGVATSDYRCRSMTQYGEVHDEVPTEHRRQFVRRWLDRMDVNEELLE